MIKARYLMLISIILIVGCVNEIDSHGDSVDAISPETLNNQLTQVKILDIRSSSEYEDKHIAGAFVIPLEQISESELSALGFQKTDDIVVYGNSEISARRARTLLKAIGYNTVRILNGGLVHWEEDGFQLAQGPSAQQRESSTEVTASSIHIEPLERDLGIISKKNGVVTTTFAIVNNGEKEVLIEEVSTSCGCTSAQLPKNTILPGERVSLTVEFDPNFHQEPLGKFTRTVFLQTSEGFELEAKIHVEIEEDSNV